MNRQAILKDFKATFPHGWVKDGLEWEDNEAYILWSGEESMVEEDIPMFDYYSLEFDPKEEMYEMSIHKKARDWAEKHNLHWECYDPGTWHAFEN